MAEGLAQENYLQPEVGIAAMQSINVVVLNPVFFAVFFGTAVIALVLASAAIFRWSDADAPCLLAGSLLYLVGTILVTMVLNVPLNNRIASTKPGSAEGSGLWRHYLSSWTAWNHVRTLTSLAAAACFIFVLS
jgi:uncharacterized membrane protein